MYILNMASYDVLMYMTEVMFLPSSGDRSDAPDIAVVITDGVSNVDPDLVPDAAVKAHKDVSTNGVHSLKQIGAMEYG